MPVSVTSARISAAVPDAVSLTTTAVNQIVAGAKSANINHLTVTAPWASIQTGRSTWSWTALDRIVNAAYAARLGIHIVLDGPTPSWATSPVNPAQFAVYASSVAARYRRKVTGFHIWNYPNIGDFWPTAPSPEQYSVVLRSAHSAIKRVDPSNAVILGTLQPATSTRTRAVIGRIGRGARARVSVPSELSPVDFLARLYTLGSRPYFDAVSYSPLSLPTVQMTSIPAPSGDSIKQSDQVREVMSTRGDVGKKLHWTVGYDTGSFTQTQQALYLDTVRWFAESRKDHVGQLTVHAYRDQA